jgi:hypothetical protein
MQPSKLKRTSSGMNLVNVRSEPLLAVRYESQVYTAIWSEQLSREERELKREESLNTWGELCFPRRAGERIT